MCMEVKRIFQDMEPGKESEHLNNIIRTVDFKGSEVVLLDGTICEGGGQPIPYPAYAWDWRCVQSYTWSQPQHINVLELTVF